MAEDSGCVKNSSVEFINPIMSARLRTHKKFSFKYGRVEVIAKMPAGDWLWPGRYFNELRERPFYINEGGQKNWRKKFASDILSKTKVCF